MKRIAIAFVCMIMATGAVMAQKTFTFGPKIGVDYTHFWGKNAKHGGRFNYQAGVFFEYRFTSKISIAPEVVFAAQGGQYDVKAANYSPVAPAVPHLKMGPGPGVDLKCTCTVNYVNIPVMFKYYIVPSLSVDLGPQLGINVYSKFTEKSTTSGNNYKYTTDEKDLTNTIDFGVGLGFTYNLATDVFVQARYTMGLTKVYKDGYNPHPKNGNAQIAIGYRF